ncbi:MAG TPA: hypothetical protein VI357_24145 [Mycobacteriales bacterium]
MRALIVVESSFGNTLAVASAVAEGLERSLTVDIRDAADAPLDLTDAVDGYPTVSRRFGRGWSDGAAIGGSPDAR